ncbi:MAG: hypothetical protein IT176_11425 [Acidobacteria bacterium]|nr:hypothetical protein [Acidobacteriota bacterium]
MPSEHIPPFDDERIREPGRLDEEAIDDEYDEYDESDELDEEGEEDENAGDEGSGGARE